MSIYDNRLFTTTSYLIDYISDVLFFDVRGHHEGVLQVDLGLGDSVEIHARMHESMDWITILTVTDEPVITEIVLAPHMRVSVLNSSGEMVQARISV